MAAASGHHTTRTAGKRRLAASAPATADAAWPDGNEPLDRPLIDQSHVREDLVGPVAIDDGLMMPSTIRYAIPTASARRHAAIRRAGNTAR